MLLKGENLNRRTSRARITLRFPLGLRPAKRPLDGKHYCAVCFFLEDSMLLCNISFCLWVRTSTHGHRNGIMLLV